MGRLLDEDIRRLVDIHADARKLADDLGLSQLVISANPMESHSTTRVDGEVERLNIDVTNEGERLCMEYVQE